jgi:D-alanyl-D-alanine carboxypeptidase/D-alanyl-D-alanine-endopeptidase (penicillin-binding protein 4)
MLKKIILLSLLLLNVAANAQVAEKLARAFNGLTLDPQAKYATTALVVLDASSGKLVFGKNENLGLATASTLKVITAATAFGILGKDFNYQTTLAYSGSINPEGVLNGNLIIVGGGDPTLGSWRYEQTKENQVLNQWVKAIKAAGIKAINGSVIGDDSLWGTTTLPEGWIWQDIGNYYGATPAALTWRENQFDIHLSSGASAGSEVKTTGIVPAMPYLKIINELKTGRSGSGDKAYAFAPPLTDIAYLRGTWGLGLSKSGISVALPDPGFDAAYRLQNTLKRLGIASSLEPTTSRKLAAENKKLPAITSTLVTITSPNLSQIIYWFNKKSINLYGEHLIRTIAWKAGKEATTSNGVAEELKYWAAKGIDKNALNIVDGSGLSPGTRVTPLAMANILFQAQKENWYSDYLKSFPINNGMTLKSGSINDVQAYAGYYTSTSGKKYIIVININNYSGSGISNKLFSVLDALK